MTMKEFYKEFSTLIKYEDDENVKVQIMAFNHLLEDDQTISIYIQVKIDDEITSYDIKEIPVADMRNITEKEEKAILKEVTKVAKSFKEKYCLFEFNIEVYDKYINTP